MLKEKSEILAVDQRNLLFGASIESFHQYLNSLTLSELVPENIRNKYEISRNLFLYSYFVYEFGAVAYHNTFICMEAALKERFKQDGIELEKHEKGLNKLLRKAIDLKFLQIDAFEGVIKVNDKEKYLNELPNLIARMRNSIAHGETFIHAPHMLMQSLAICKSILEGIFSKH